MKKLIAVIISASVLFALCACSNTNNSSETGNNSTVASSNEGTTNVGDKSTSNSEKSTNSSSEKQTEYSSSSNPLDNIIIENQGDVTNADGSVNEEIIGTTKPKTSDNSPYATTKQQSFETDIIPIE